MEYRGSPHHYCPGHWRPVPRSVTGVTDLRGALHRERIVRAAVDIIERDGADALSMRRVAAELGAATMSLYNHVSNKAELLDSVADYVMADMEFAADPKADWREQARGLARTFREIARRHPRSILVVITRQPRSATGLHILELVLGAVRKGGFEGATAVRLVRTFEVFILGSLMREASLAEKPPPELDRYEEVLGVASMPNIRALLPVLVEQDHDSDFEFGLDLLIAAAAALPRG
jgi:AcrR family transcriptional regulator